MHQLYDENDCVYKGESINETISNYFAGHEQIPGSRNQLNSALTQAKATHQTVISAKTGLTAAWDNRNQEFLLIAKDEYNPANLAAVLFDLLVDDSGSLELEEILSEVDELIDRYIDRIERMEELDFSGEKQQLKTLIKTMRETISMVDEAELSDSELERLSDQIDNDYYAPAAETLEKVLERIALPLRLAGSET